MSLLYVNKTKSQVIFLIFWIKERIWLLKFSCTFCPRSNYADIFIGGILGFTCYFQTNKHSNIIILFYKGLRCFILVTLTCRFETLETKYYRGKSNWKRAVEDQGRKDLAATQIEERLSKNIKVTTKCRDGKVKM